MKIILEIYVKNFFFHVIFNIFSSPILSSCANKSFSWGIFEILMGQNLKKTQFFCFFLNSPVQPGLLISWGILNPVWNNSIGSRFGPNLYRQSQRNLFWSSGCSGSNTYDPNSACWRHNETEIDSTTKTTGNAVERVEFKNTLLPLAPTHGLSLLRQPMKRGEVGTYSNSDMAWNPPMPDSNYFGAYYLAPI
jgi:hypothetical protein